MALKIKFTKKQQKVSVSGFMVVCLGCFLTEIFRVFLKFINDFSQTEFFHG